MSESKLIITNLKILAIFLTVVLTLCGAASGQSINDDLKPTVKTVKAKTTAKPEAKAVKTVKKVSRQPKPTAAKSSVKPIKTAKVVKSKETAAPVPAPTPPAVVYSETPEQIINRFMNFQQSDAVTDKDWQSVMAQTAKTLQENPNHSVAKAQSLVAQGEIAYNQRSFPAAISFFKSASQILPESSLPLYGLGKVYLANGQAKAAEQSFKEALNRNEGFALAYKGMGDALAAQGEKKKAVKYFKKATEAGVKKGSLP